jgi:iron complex transport system substrate-binding protein
MGQRYCIVLMFLLALVVSACDKPGEVEQSSDPHGIVSLSPAATDLVMQLGLADRIVGVSAYEADAELKSRLPVVGDYERIDWERVAQLKPRYLIVQGQPDRLPAGLTERCAAMGIKLVNIQIDRLDDISLALVRLAGELGDEQAGLDAARRLQIALDAISTPNPTPALILLNENGKFVAGRDTFLDDLLTRAGGTNVIQSSGYPTIDQELLLTLKPETIFVLLAGSSDATVAEARMSVERAAVLPAVKNGRVFVVTRSDVLLPSYRNAVQLLKEMAEKLPRSSM